MIDNYNLFDLIFDSYTRNQLYGNKIRYIKISMSSESGRDGVRLLINGRQIEASTLVSNYVSEYTIAIDPMANIVGFSLSSLSLETQGRFYIDKVTFVLQ